MAHVPLKPIGSPRTVATDDRTFISTMQSINDAILNGWFFLAFLGALLLTGLAGATQFGAGRHPALPWIIAAFVLYGLTIVTTTKDFVRLAGHHGKAEQLAVRCRDRPGADFLPNPAAFSRL